MTEDKTADRLVNLKNNSTDTTSAASSWLIIQASSLQIPENLLLLIPLAIFLPVVVKWWKAKREGRKLSFRDAAKETMDDIRNSFSILYLKSRRFSCELSHMRACWKRRRGLDKSQY